MGDVWLSDDRLISREDWEKFLKEAMDTEITLEFEWDIGERLKYALKTPEILEKAWKIPWKRQKKEDFKPILVIFGSNLDILDGNSRIERDREVTKEIMEFHKLSPLLTSDTEFHCWNLRNKTYCPKDWRDFK